MFASTLLLTIASSLFYIFYRIRRQQMTVFKKLGIPGPEPNFLFGNLLEFRHSPLYKKHQQWRQEFGETFGYYEGPTPVLVTSDVKVVQEVFIKQFNKFHARKLWPVQVNPDKDEDVHMFFARGRRWKRLRLVVNPAFSAAKIRKMAPTVNECINHLLDVIKDSANAATDKTIELLELFRRLTLDTILRCEVGLDQNSVKNPDDPFLTYCKGVIDDTAKMPWLYLLGFLFPNLHFAWIAIYKFLHNIKLNPVYWLEDRMREVVVMRRNIKENRRVDLMQQMLDAQFVADSVHELESEESRRDKLNHTTFKSMTNEEIVSHALLFLLAGYETTSTTLSYIFFELSQNPDVQQRLRHEVKTVLSRGYNNIDYDDLKKLTYLDYVIWETLRKYPLASTVTARCCMEDCVVGDLKIPAGVLVHANVWDIHYDSKHWGHDPNSFDPLRFMPERRRTRHPNAWMPFGSGPRSCAGLRFALLQLKMVVSKVLRDFDFHPSHKHNPRLTLKEGATILPEHGVALAAWRRGSAITEAGLRRGSLLTGIPLSEWTRMRRASIRTEDMDQDDDDDISVEDGSIEDMKADKLKYMHMRRRSYRNISKHPASLVHETGLMNGRCGLALRASVSQASAVTRFLTNETKEECEVVNSGNELVRQSLMEAENTPCMPHEILGQAPQLKSCLTARRASAIPELQALTETAPTHVFRPQVMPGLTAISIDDCFQEDIMMNRNRIFQRRGSG